MTDHDWGPGPRPDWDGKVCRDCGMVASNTEISTGYWSQNWPNELLPGCPAYVTEDA